MQGKESDSVAFMVNDIKFVQFKMHDENPLLVWASDWGEDEDDELTLSVVGELSINEYNGIYTPQVTIKESFVDGVD